MGGVSSTSRVWSPGQGLRQRPGSKLVQAGAPWCPLTPSPGLTRALKGSVDTWMSGQEGERVLCQCGREGRKGRQWTSREGRSGGHPLSPAHTAVTGHGGGWRQTLTATSTDRQTCTPRLPRGLSQQVQRGTEPAAARPPWGLPAQPRSPPPGQTTSRGECVGPTG